jgi:hypothetical protein
MSSMKLFLPRSSQRGYQRRRHLRQANLPPTSTSDWKRFQRLVRITMFLLIINIFYFLLMSLKISKYPSKKKKN